MKIVTGYRGTPHISANDQQAFNQGVIGGGNYVLDVGNHFEASLENVNTVQIRDGNGVMQGVHFRIEPGDFEDLNIENGTTGFSRIDLIVARYTKDSTTGIESVDLVVIKGEDAESNPVAPGYNTGSILNGDSPVDFPMYKVTVNELTPSLTSLFTSQPTLSNLNDLFIIKRYRGAYTLTGSQAKAIYGNDVGYTSYPDGYTPVAIKHFDTQSNEVFTRYLQPNGFGSSTLAAVKNTTSSSVSANFTVEILFAKAIYCNY